MFTICDADTPDSPLPIFERLLRSHVELGELKDMLDAGLTVAFMFRAGEFKLSGRNVLGACYMPGVTGALRPLFEFLLEERLGYFPTWLIILSEDFWTEAPAIEREILVFHEALHCGQAQDQYGAPKFSRQSGEPVACLRPHDLEEFNAVVRRYGAWKSDVANFLDAALTGVSDAD